ncbi:hypothetical protein B0H14DRAFT_1193707 [Mycena olivaceomarginata]|nr:hypothetical protein B0H14DRAFT_1193707 [Mycena olivaceomarginata]
MVQLYRCYVIWGFQKKPIILPMLLIASTLVAVILSSLNKAIAVGKITTITTILAAATHVILTSLTAGRILWIQRAASHVALDSSVRGRYTTAIVIILESGAIYCAAAIFLVVSVSVNEVVFSIGFGIGQQVMNIVPTFTLVYIGLKNMRENQPADLESGSKVSPNTRLHARSHTRSSCADIQVGLYLPCRYQDARHTGDFWDHSFGHLGRAGRARGANTVE